MNHKIYLDNAASTKVHPIVLEEIIPIYKNGFGNPSSSHSFGKSNKAKIELARKNIAKHFNVQANEIIFCSSGSEANNMLLQNAFHQLGIRNFITTKIEHKCVSNTLLYLEEEFNINIHYVDSDLNGMINPTNLSEILATINAPSLISVIHVQNEIGSIQNLQQIGEIANQYNAIFHSDTVQSIGKIPIDAKECKLDYFTASAHKFHGPIGIGFLFKTNKYPFKTWIHGGGHERNIRSSTENYPGIIGMDKALQIAFKNQQENYTFISELKEYFKTALQKLSSSISFNSNVNSTPYILSANFPNRLINDTFFINLDIEDIAVSAGSACQSGALKESAILKEIGVQNDFTTIRFSFSIFNTFEEIESVVQKLQRLIKQ